MANAKVKVESALTVNNLRKTQKGPYSVEGMAINYTISKQFSSKEIVCL
jgi:hypothetical protein